MYNCRASTPARKTFRFPRSHRLTREADLEVVRRTGKRMRTTYLEVRSLASLLLHPRVGVIVPKYKHTIVERNRLRRRLRELVRNRLIPVLPCVDIVIRSMPQAYSATFDDLAREIDQVVTRMAVSINA